MGCSSSKKVHSDEQNSDVDVGNVDERSADNNSEVGDKIEPLGIFIESELDNLESSNDNVLPFEPYKKIVQNSLSNITDDYTIYEKIGEGAFSEVMRAVNNTTQEEVAIKFIKKELLFAEPNMEELIMNEINIQKRLKHPHIVRLIEVYESMEHVCLVLDLVSGGMLFDRIIALGSYTERDASLVMLTLFRTIKYIHSQNVAHRDLKPENMLYESKSPTALLKISDFGMAAVCMPGELMTLTAGSLHYAAPEILGGEGYGLEADIWSLGIIMYILLCGTFPFDAPTGPLLVVAVRKGDFTFPAQSSSPLSEHGKHLISKILVVDPKERLTVDEILAHPWFTTAIPSYELSATKKNLMEFRVKRRWKAAVFAIRMTQNLGKSKK